MPFCTHGFEGSLRRLVVRERLYSGGGSTVVESVSGLPRMEIIPFVGIWRNVYFVLGMCEIIMMGVRRNLAIAEIT